MAPRAQKRTSAEISDESDGGEGRAPATPMQKRTRRHRQADDEESGRDDDDDDEESSDDGGDGRRGTQRGGKNAKSSPAKGAGARKGKGKARKSVQIDSDAEEMVERDEEEARKDEELERRLEVKVAAAFEQRRNFKGRVAETGVIESLELSQFMCHQRYSVKFGPQLNFIIGHNGSGKSAILSGLMIALGGASHRTGRGTGLRGFVREGQSQAEVTVGIKNRGEEAYKHDIYGDTIYVVRRFTREGGSSYKIKSSDGKVISKKRDELSAICDHMNIQVDNPMTVLTQDKARSFLAANSPRDKYESFLSGTQLKQLSEAYQQCEENIDIVKTGVTRAKAALKDAEEKVTAAATRFEQAEKAREMGVEREKLAHELAWAYVDGKKHELEEQMKKIIKQKKRMDSISAEMTKAQNTVNEVTARMEELEAKLPEENGHERLETEKTAINEQIKLRSRQIADIRTENRVMDQTVRRLNTQIASLEAQIVAETKKLEEESRGAREAMQMRIQEAQEAVEANEVSVQAVKVQLETAGRVRTEAGEAGRTAQNEVERLRREIEGQRARIQMCKGQAAGDLTSYGRNIRAVLSAIESARWAGERPVGPLGLFVDLTDERWAGVLRNVLGGNMMSFAVSDSRDLGQLRKILRDSGNNETQVIVSPVDIFDYSRGEPPPGVLTILRVLNISNEWVKRILINASRIESTGLAMTRAEGDQLVRQGGVSVCCTADLYNVRRYSDGGFNSAPLNKMQTNDPRQTLFVKRANIGAEIRHHEELMEQAIVALRAAEQMISESRRNMMAADGDVRQLAAKEHEGRTLGARLQHELRNLRENANEAAPVNVAALEAAKKSAEDEKESTINQFKSASERSRVLEEERKPLVARLGEINAALNERQGEIDAIKEQIIVIVAERQQKQKDAAYWELKYTDENKIVTDMEEQEKEYIEELTTWREGALKEYPEEIVNPQPAAKLVAKLKSLDNTLATHTREQGATHAEITKILNDAQAARNNIKTQMQEMGRLAKVLAVSLQSRKDRWIEFRRHIAVRCKMQFQFHLSTRGYFGHLNFDHQACKLDLKVQTDDQAGTQRDKDPRSLSGGEKSFSTICLLLSLWESIGSPIRCLDEFDVFMDAVNRRVSMTMMMEMANSSDSKQYILITPQDMANVPLGPSVRVNRIGDPERGQTTL